MAERLRNTQPVPRATAPRPHRATRPDCAAIFDLQRRAGNAVTAALLAPHVTVQRLPILVTRGGALVSVEPIDLVLDELGAMPAAGAQGSPYLQTIQETLLRVQREQGTAEADAIITNPLVYPPIKAQLTDIGHNGDPADMLILRRMYTWFGVPTDMVDVDRIRQPEEVLVSEDHIHDRHLVTHFFANSDEYTRDVNQFFPLSWTVDDVRARLHAVLLSDECYDAVVHSLINGTERGTVRVTIDGYLFQLGFQPIDDPPEPFLLVDQFFPCGGTPRFTAEDIDMCEYEARRAVDAGRDYIEAVVEWFIDHGQPL